MKILLPTDFSVSADNALSYAAAFAKDTKSSLVVYHCYYPKINPATVLSTPGMDQHIDTSLQKLEARIAPYKEQGLSIKSSIEVGFIVDKIVEDAEKEAFDLIIMGNTGQGHGESPLFGSVSSETALRAPCPVLLIPSGHQYQQPKEIALASNAHSLQKKFLDRVISIALQLNAQLDLVHIDSDPDTAEKVQLKAQLTEQLESARISYLSIQNESLIDGLNHYADSNETDWLVMVPREKSFWQKLFLHSNTKAMAGNSRFPLLVIHNRDTKTETS